MKKEEDRVHKLHKPARAKTGRTIQRNTPRHEWRNNPPTMTRGR
jgi:hypothetical protein